MSFKDKVIGYLKEKWSLAKPILIKYLNSLKDACVDYSIKLWSLVKTKTVAFAKIVWNKTTDMFHSLKTIVFEKEMAFLEKWADWLLEKADSIYEKLNKDIINFIDDLDGDSEGDSEDSDDSEIPE